MLCEFRKLNINRESWIVDNLLVICGKLQLMDFPNLPYGM